MPPVGEAEALSVAEVIRSGWLVRGPKVEQFERLLEGVTGAKRVVATNSCTAALYLALKAVGVGPGDEVITTPLTFAATANAVWMAGATPVFADVEPDSLLLDPDSVRDKVTSSTAAVVPVHLYGNPCDMDRIRRVAGKCGIGVVEDAAQALGASQEGLPVGTAPNPVCFSFHAAKNITTGEGGAVAVPDLEMAEKILRWSHQGIEKFPVEKVVDAGFKFSMCDVQAAIGIPQVPNLVEYVGLRSRAFARYREDLPDVEFVASPHGVSAYNMCTVLVPERDRILKALADKHEVRTRFPPLHLEPYYRQTLCYRAGDLPVAEAQADRLLNLPLHQAIRMDEVDRVADDLGRFL